MRPSNPNNPDKGPGDSGPQSAEVARHWMRLADALERAGVRESAKFGEGKAFDALSLQNYLHPGLVEALSPAQVTFVSTKTVPALLELFSATQAKLSGFAHILRTRYSHVDHIADALDAEGAVLDGVTRDLGVLFGFDYRYLRTKIEHDEKEP